MQFAAIVVTVGLSGLALTAATSNAIAQTAPPPASGSAQGGSGESLSSKLGKSGGVITPKEGVDPGIKVTPPDPHPNSMPVIPPSANGGGTAK